MNRLSVANIFVWASLLVSLTLACSLLGGGATPKHFENDEISFDYPGGWRTFSEVWSTWEPQRDPSLDAEEIVGVVASGFSRSVRIERRELPSGSSLKDVYEQTYQNTWISEYATSHAISEGTITVDGVTAYEKVYQRPHGEPWYQMREVWLEKGGRVYILSCWAKPGQFDEAQEEFNLIIESFHVK